MPFQPTFALIGNPNTGKSTIFNCLTGLRVRTGNYPGVTIEAKFGEWFVGTTAVQLIDLPGTYSLSAQSPDERVVLDLLSGKLLGGTPLTGIIAIADASNLQRQLYLLSQLLELDTPVILVLNQMDVAEQKGVTIDCVALAERLGILVVPMQAHRQIGLDRLAAAVLAIRQSPAKPPLPCLAWPTSFAHAIEALQTTSTGATIRRLIDIDKPTECLPEGTPSLAALEAGVRYAWIRTTLQHIVTNRKTVQPVQERLDAVFTHKIWGMLFFLLLTAGVFQALYAWAAPLMEWISAGTGDLGTLLGHRLPDGMLRSLVVDGAIAGVGSVLVFLPQIVILFTFLAILEDCGYMARAAFLMDRVFARVGLSGKSFLPLLSSFACAVPGIMATRTIENRRDRLATMMVAPLMSCSARLPVYVLLIGAFVPNVYFIGVIGLQGFVLFLMSILGLLVAVPVIWCLKRTALKGATPPFVMELPSYKWPVFRVVAARVYERARAFVVQAGTIICGISIVIWALSYFPHAPAIHAHYEQLRQSTPADTAATHDALEHAEAADYLRASYLGQLGQWIEPAVRPLGWDWRIGMATLASFPAREVVIAVLGTIFQVGNNVDETSESLFTQLKAATWPDGRPLFTMATALSLMIFFALCCQCMATVVAIRREANSWSLAGLTFAYMTALAYLAALLTFQIGSRL